VGCFGQSFEIELRSLHKPDYDDKISYSQKFS